MRYTLARITLLAALAAVRADDQAKPPIKVAADGFPAGRDTPEGAACDLVRAFIQRDAKLFEETCLKPFVRGEVPRRVRGVPHGDGGRDKKGG